MNKYICSECGAAWFSAADRGGEACSTPGCGGHLAPTDQKEAAEE
jgi:DNA-directed RNA polymerase subunit RPC12/RpoP